MAPTRYDRRHAGQTAPKDNRPLPGWAVAEVNRREADPPEPKGGCAHDDQ